MYSTVSSVNKDTFSVEDLGTKNLCAIKFSRKVSILLEIRNFIYCGFFLSSYPNGNKLVTLVLRNPRPLGFLVIIFSTTSPHLKRIFFWVVFENLGSYF